MRKIFHLIHVLRYKFWLLRQYLKYGFKAKEFHYGSYIGKPLILNGIENISIGEKSYIQANGYIEAIPYTGESSCEFKMGKKNRINFGAHIIATKSIVIGDCCEIAPYVYIADNTHTYENINVPIVLSPIKQLRPVTIGDGTWIGTRAVIIGCSIGKHCVIGANSVVKHDIPDYCVAAGIPARIIKRYDFGTKSWRKTNPQGEFID